MKNQFILITCVSLVILLITLGIMHYASFELPSLSLFALAFYFLLTIGLHALVTTVIKSNRKTFAAVFMGSQGIRMFCCVSFLILYLIFTQKIQLPFIIYFLSLYLLFTGFEIYLLLFNLRTDFTKGSDNP